MNNIQNYLEFKLTEVSNTNYLDLYIHRNNTLHLGIYRKPHKQTVLHISHPIIH